MGWTSYQAHMYKNGRIDRKAELDNVFTGNLVDRDWNVKGYTKPLKSRMVGSTYYAAVLRHEDDPEVEDVVYALVALTTVESGELSYKDMDETMGPYAYDCPLSILKMLTPTDDKFSNDWRQKCYDRHASKKDPKSPANLPLGSKVTWTVGSDGWECFDKGEIVTLVKSKQRGRYIWNIPSRPGRFIYLKNVPVAEIEVEESA